MVASSGSVLYFKKLLHLKDATFLFVDIRLNCLCNSKFALCAGIADNSCPDAMACKTNATIEEF